MSQQHFSSQRHLSPLDQLLGHADRALKTLVPGGTHAQRRPADDINSAFPAADPTPSTDNNPAHTAALMRINHTGEVCAQALYQGQAATARLPHVRYQMEQAAREEEDHLAWCEERLQELGSHTSRLNPFFYLMSFALGAAAGLAGDRWSLGFVAETERQVVRHLDNHLEQVPESDHHTRAILKQMREDELHHATHASEAGGAPLPSGLQELMRLMSRIMTWTTYRF
jgi:ubiquinone biosynthesis monooxygenase Coq7